MSTTTHPAAPEGRKSNRLATEASPYLLQHAYNPVEWWPWSAAALAEAKRRDVPILLSIGYSACHWCHVMERESFEDEGIARAMNELFVNIKVDREERPDLDQIYQLVVQLMGRSGGWPLTVFLTPSQKPFFAGTYFPPEDRRGTPGFPKILQAISEAYRERREEVDGQADELTKAIAEVGDGAGEAPPFAPGPDLLERATRQLLRRFDDAHGGFGRAPKFPNTMPLEVVLRRGVVEGDSAAREAARLQLESMRAGGIWDHLGGGFHRYSTDERWLVPHFEKMLYDNALLLRAYVDGYRALGEASFAATAREIAAWVEREMTDPEGGYYASQDADSEGEEGKFFVWDESEVKQALGADALAVKAAVDYFGITPAGNFADPREGAIGGVPKSVLFESRPARAVAAKLDITVDAARDAIERARRAMFDERERRPKPQRDEKVLTSWSALMISAIAEAAGALDDPKMLASAERAFAFVEANLLTPHEPHRAGQLVRAARLAKKVTVEGEPSERWLVKGPGFLDDQAYLANAALDLHEVTGDPSKVRLAEVIVDGMLDAFWSEEDGFFFTPRDGEALITRSKDAYDNAVPSGTSMAVRALARLGALVDARYGRVAEAELARLAPAAVANPFGYGQTLCELDRLVRGSVDVVLVGPRGDARTKALARAVFAVWLPNRTIAWVDPGDPSSRAAVALLAEGKPETPAPAAYVCRGRTCSLPVTTPEALTALLTSGG
ncbi:MAG: thioredoxin domain-containing protein [Labilithrix sp.]|nr:thioredoxin domain-containing protein [Labilithrix sp.]